MYFYIIIYFKVLYFLLELILCFVTRSHAIFLHCYSIFHFSFIYQTNLVNLKVLKSPHDNKTIDL